MHFFLPPLVTHVFFVTNAEWENLSPVGRPIETDETFGPFLP